MHQDKDMIVIYWEKLQRSLMIISHTFTYKGAKGTWFDFLGYIVQKKMVILLNCHKSSTPSLSWRYYIWRVLLIFFFFLYLDVFIVVHACGLFLRISVAVRVETENWPG